jgi:hypothetical protein
MTIDDIDGRRSPGIAHRRVIEIGRRRHSFAGHGSQTRRAVLR